MSDYKATIRALFNQIDAMAWAIDTDGTITVSEGAHLVYSGVVPGQLEGQNLLTMYQHDPATIAEFKRALAGETIQNRGDVGDRFMETRMAPVFDERGGVTGVVGITTDRTDQRRDQREIAAQTAALREQAELLDLAHDAIIVRRLDGTITFWNRGAERIYGFSRAVAQGRELHELLRTRMSVPLEQIERELLSHSYWEGELTHTRADGQQVVTASRWVLRRGEAGAPDSVLEIDNDITERKRAEEAAAQRQQEIIRAQALAIEELSTPLIPITDDILVMPLVGMLDSVRAKQIMHSLLTGLAASRGKFAIIDITGVPVVDTAVANALLQAAHAARLLGTEVILTGIRPEVAQTLVHIDAKLGSITTRGTLQSGIKHALGRRTLGAA
jgi:rsbT co-antagonist protein RsbR